VKAEIIGMCKGKDLLEENVSKKTEKPNYSDRRGKGSAGNGERGSDP
jgi:hypothetical protein